MAIKDYYGEKKATTKLDIYSETEDGNKIIHRSLKNQEAYDTWHLSYYYKELLEYDSLLNRDNIDFNDIPHKEKNLLIYLLLLANPTIKTIVEIGSSLFEMIEGLEVVDEFSHLNFPQTTEFIYSYDFIGIELSDLFAHASKHLHPNYSINIYKTPEIRLHEYGLLFDKSVSNYIFEDTDEFSKYMNKFQIGYVNSYMAIGNTFISNRLGKQLTYFSLEEMINKLDKPLYHLFGRKAPGNSFSKDREVVEGFFLNCTKEIGKKFMEISKINNNITKYFKKKDIQLREASYLL